MNPVHSVTASAPGKTNLFFAVGPLQEDGFHDVASVYLALDLREEVTVTPAASWSVSVTGNVSADQIASVPTDESNLVVKAAKHVAELAGVDAQPVSFTINKHVPVAGGMGGGSADAAAALAAVDALWCTGVEEKLSESVELGADVPFALAGGIAIGLGRGEVLTQIEAVRPIHLVLVTSDEGLSTPAVYRRLDELRAARGIDPKLAAEATVPADLIRALQTGDQTALASLLKNDLQEAALDLRPDLKKSIDAGLAAGAIAGFVSGSGPTIAFLVADEEQGLDLAVALTSSGVVGSVARAYGPVHGAKVI